MPLMKFFSLPRSWKRKNKPSQSSTNSSSSGSTSSADSGLCARIGASPNALPSPPIAEKAILMAPQKATDTKRDELAFRSLSHVDSKLDGHPRVIRDNLRVNVQLPSTPDSSFDSTPSSGAHWPPPEHPLVPRPPLSHAVSNPMLNAQTHHTRPLTTSPPSQPRSVRPKRSMPELDGIWKGFLDDVEEDDDSIRFECEDDPTPKASEQVFPTHYSPRIRPTSPLKIIPKSPTVPQIKYSASVSHLPHLLQGPRADSSAASHRPKISSHKSLADLKTTSKFPLSLFPAPPPVVSNPSVHNPLIQDRPVVPATQAPKSRTRRPATSPGIGTPSPPMLVRKRPAPRPLKLHVFPPTAQVYHPSPPESPLPCTPTTPRSLQQPSSRPHTSCSPVSILKKSMRGSGNHAHPSPCFSAPTSPDYFGYVPSSHPFSPAGSEQFSLASSRATPSDPDGEDSSASSSSSHRATLSESKYSSSSSYTEGTSRRRAFSRPDVLVPPRRLGEDAYMQHPRTVPVPAQHIQWGYAV